MKAVVVYRSKTGFTKKYAQWIATELDADLFRESAVGVKTLADYDLIIYGGGLYAGGIDGVKLITKNLGRLSAKKIVVFATGATPQREETVCELEKQNFTPEQLERIRFFYLRGGFDYSKLSPFNKVMMNLLRWSLQHKQQLTADEQGMLAAYDWTAHEKRRSKSWFHIAKKLIAEKKCRLNLSVLAQSLAEVCKQFSIPLRIMYLM